VPSARGPRGQQDQRAAVAQKPDPGSDLVTRIQESADGQSGVTFIGSDERGSQTWDQIVDRAAGIASGLEAIGVGRGARVAFLSATSAQLAAGVVAAWLTGAAVTVLPRPTRTKSAGAMLRRCLDVTHNTVLIADQPHEHLAAEISANWAPFTALARTRRGFKAGGPTAGDLAVLQLTSGSEGMPKAVPLTHQQVCSNLDAICWGSEFDVEREVFVSWLPLYHDMGFIGLFVLPVSRGMRLVIADPTLWVQRPRRWMEWVA
jgi:fatty-acyl-CoA synthase